MIEVGRLCVKIAGRDACKKCVIVSVLEGNFVLIDGETRRRKCNILHLEPLEQVIDIKKDASHSDVVFAFKNLGIELVESKSKKKTVRPRTLRRSKLAKAAPEKPAAKPAVKKAVKKSADKVVDAEVVTEEKTIHTVKKAKTSEEKK